MMTHSTGDKFKTAGPDDQHVTWPGHEVDFHHHASSVKVYHGLLRREMEVNIMIENRSSPCRIADVERCHKSMK